MRGTSGWAKAVKRVLAVPDAHDGTSTAIRVRPGMAASKLRIAWPEAAGIGRGVHQNTRWRRTA